jgi:hypothetical protein
MGRPMLELADRPAIAAGEPKAATERPALDGWYDPDSIAFVDGADWAADFRPGGFGGTRRLEIIGSLPDEA